jgi:hypothetical protein
MRSGDGARSVSISREELIERMEALYREICEYLLPPCVNVDIKGRVTKSNLQTDLLIIVEGEQPFIVDAFRRYVPPPGRVLQEVLRQC